MQPAYRRHLFLRVVDLLGVDRLLGLEDGVHALGRHDLLTLIVEDERKVAIEKYDQAGTRYRHHAKLREYVKIKQMDKAAEKWLQEQALQSAVTKQELPDIINVLIEELIQRRFELPSFSYLFRLARTSRATVNDRIYKAVSSSLPPEIVRRIDAILQPAHGRSMWDSLKREPKQPNVREVTDFLQHIDVMIDLAEGLPNTEDIAATKREQLVLEARALDLAEMRALKPMKRYTLAVLLIQTQLQKAMDDVADIFIKTMRNLHNVAAERLRQYHLGQAEQVERLIGQFREVLTVFSEDGTADQRVARVETSLDGTTLKVGSTNATSTWPMPATTIIHSCWQGTPASEACLSSAWKR